MKFTEFINRNKNVVQSSTAKRISNSITVTEERDAFYNGELFKKYDMVESEGVSYRILEQCSNYYQVVDKAGNVSRKFAKQLNKATPVEILMTESLFHGYTPVSDSAKWLLKDHFPAFSAGECDDVGLLKSLKEADKMDTQYKSKDKLTVAKIIADAVGIPHDAISTPENLVNAAIVKAKKDPALMKNKAILQNMLQIAKEVGIKYSDKAFDVNEAEAPLKHHSVMVSYHKKSDPHRRFEARFKTTHNSDKKETEKRAHAAFAEKGRVVYNMVHEDVSESDKSVENKEHEHWSPTGKVGTHLQTGVKGKEYAHYKGGKATGNIKWKYEDGKEVHESVEEAVEKPNKDMTGTNCTKCKKDKYQERSQHDDMDGKVTCSCGHRVSRWKNYTEKNESVELEELSVNTLKTYSQLAKKHATHLAAQGAKAKTPETAYKKMDKASDRLEGAAKADKKAFAADWKKRIGA